MNVILKNLMYVLRHLKKKNHSYIDASIFE